MADGTIIIISVGCVDRSIFDETCNEKTPEVNTATCVGNSDAPTCLMIAVFFFWRQVIIHYEMCSIMKTINHVPVRVDNLKKVNDPL